MTSRQDGETETICYDQVINASWEDLLHIDATACLPAPEGASFRLRYIVRVRAPHGGRGLRCASVVLGAFGDLVEYHSGDLFLSWYPVGRRGMVTALRPPAHWPRGAQAGDIAEVENANIRGAPGPDSRPQLGRRRIGSRSDRACWHHLRPRHDRYPRPRQRISPARRDWPALDRQLSLGRHWEIHHGAALRPAPRETDRWREALTGWPNSADPESSWPYRSTAGRDSWRTRSTRSSPRTHRDLRVMISVDGHDAESADVCAPFLADTRVRMVVQERRLGWVANMNWLIDACDGDLFCYWQQDDLCAPDYFDKLVTAFSPRPDAACSYSDLRWFGRVSHEVKMPAMVGFAQQRILAQIEALNWIPLRGLVPTDVLTRVGPIRGIHDSNAFSIPVDPASCRCWRPHSRT